MPIRMVEDQKYTLTQIRITFMHNHEQIDVNMNGIADRLEYSKNKKKIFDQLNILASKYPIMKIRDANKNLAWFLLKRAGLKGHHYPMWLMVEYVFKNPNKLEALRVPWQSVYAMPWFLPVTPGVIGFNTFQRTLTTHLQGIQEHIKREVKAGRVLNDPLSVVWKIIENTPRI